MEQHYGFSFDSDRKKLDCKARKRKCMNFFLNDFKSLIRELLLVYIINLRKAKIPINKVKPEICFKIKDKLLQYKCYTSCEYIYIYYNGKI